MIQSGIFTAILTGLVLTLITGWLAIKLAWKVKLLDIPGKAPHKQHLKVTPLAGGIALTLSLLILAFVFGSWRDPQVLGILLAALVIFAFGLWDDAAGLSAPLKTLGQVLATIVLVLFDVRVQIFEAPSFFFGGPDIIYVLLDYFLTFFWMIGITNAFNLVDSMDGLVAGLGCWAFGFFTLAAFDAQQLPLSILTALLLGICLALYFYNAPPARFFLGDSAAQTIGFLLAAVAILYTPLNRLQMSTWFLPILLAGVPIFDTSLVFFSRLRRHTPFYKSNLDHFYHRLVKAGLEPGRAVQVMHLVALVLDCLAFLAIGMIPLAANLIFGACLLAGIVFFFILDRPKYWQ